MNTQDNKFTIRMQQFKDIYARRKADKKEKTNPLRDRLNRPESIPTLQEIRDFFA